MTRYVSVMQLTAVLAKAEQEEDSIVRDLKARIARQQIEIYLLAAWCLGLTGYVALRRRM
jgi:hypothetical protein